MPGKAARASRQDNDDWPDTSHTLQHVLQCPRCRRILAHICSGSSCMNLQWNKYSPDNRAERLRQSNRHSSGKSCTAFRPTPPSQECIARGLVAGPGNSARVTISASDDGGSRARLGQPGWPCLSAKVQEKTLPGLMLWNAAQKTHTQRTNTPSVSGAPWRARAKAETSPTHRRWSCHCTAQARTDSMQDGEQHLRNRCRCRL